MIFDAFCSVTGFKKKTVVFLMTAALGSGVLVVCSARSATDGAESETSKFDPCQPQTGARHETGSLFANDPNFSGKPGYDTGSGELFVRAMLAVLFVVVLGAAAIYASKKLLPKIVNLPGKEIRIVETVHLGPRKAVHLLEIGNRRFLIGSTNENVTKLADVTIDLTCLSAQETDYDREYE
ncbi:MAG: FliO/MopB family protein [Planctomycetota bacterium]